MNSPKSSLFHVGAAPREPEDCRAVKFRKISGDASHGNQKTLVMETLGGGGVLNLRSRWPRRISIGVHNGARELELRSLQYAGGLDGCRWRLDEGPFVMTVAVSAKGRVLLPVVAIRGDIQVIAGFHRGSCRALLCTLR
jgi:hypothetical protein